MKKTATKPRSELKQVIGSSDIASILGVDPWQTRYMTWLRMTGREDFTSDNIYTKAGHMLEDAVAQYFSDASGHRVIKRSSAEYRVWHPHKEYLMCSPDREYFDKHEGGRGILECKTTQKKVEMDDIPRHWFCQLQWQLGITGIDKGALAWLSRGIFFDYQEFDFSKELFDQMEELADEFYHKHIIEDIEPEVVNSSDVMLKYPESYRGKEITATDEAQAAYAQIVALRSKIKSAKEELDELVEQIKLAMGDAEIMSYGDQELFTWKTSKQTTMVDAAKLKEAYPEVYDAVLKEKKRSRPFLVKK